MYKIAVRCNIIEQKVKIIIIKIGMLTDTYREVSCDRFVNWFSCLKLNLLLFMFLQNFNFYEHKNSK